MNDRTALPPAGPTMVSPHDRIGHVIYIIKKNGTYDQALPGGFAAKPDPVSAPGISESSQLALTNKVFSRIQASVLAMEPDLGPAPTDRSNVSPWGPVHSIHHRQMHKGRGHAGPETRRDDDDAYDGLAI